VNLDRRSPAPKYIGRRDPLPLRVTDIDVEVIDLLAGALRCDCRWVAKVDCVSGSKQGTTTIDDHGEPLHTSGEPLTAGEPRHATAWYRGRWVQTSPTGAPVARSGWHDQVPAAR
jgi:hypothetical protein